MAAQCLLYASFIVGSRQYSGVISTEQCCKMQSLPSKASNTGGSQKFPVFSH